MRYGRSGWFGNPSGHAMAARGIKLYAKRHQELMQPLFYAQKREAQVPFISIIDRVRQGALLRELQQSYPGVDKEDLRRRGIKAIEYAEGNRTLSAMDVNGIDASVKMARENQRVRQDMRSVLESPQKASFLPQVKVELLRQRLDVL